MRVPKASAKAQEPIDKLESELLEYRNYQSMIITGPGVEVN